MGPLLQAANIEVKSIRRVKPVGMFKVIHCRNAPARAGVKPRETGDYSAMDDAALAPAGRQSRPG